jgi:hypothetical protein
LELLKKTKPSDNATVSASFENVSISWRTVATPPQRNGKGHRAVSKPRVEIISRNEKALKALAENLTEWIQDPASTLIFSDDDDSKLPAVVRAASHMGKDQDFGGSMLGYSDVLDDGFRRRLLKSSQYILYDVTIYHSAVATALVRCHSYRSP